MIDWGLLGLGMAIGSILTGGLVIAADFLAEQRRPRLRAHGRAQER